MDRFGKSDPYVVLDLEGTQLTTSVKKRTLNPIWRETFTLNVAESNATLRVTVFDWDFAEAPDLMGGFGVEIQELIDAGVVEQFYTLRDDDGAPVQVCMYACVYVCMYVCMYACTMACLYKYIRIYVTQKYMHTHIHTYIHTHSHKYTHAYIHTYTHT